MRCARSVRAIRDLGARDGGRRARALRAACTNGRAARAICSRLLDAYLHERETVA